MKRALFASTIAFLAVGWASLIAQRPPEPPSTPRPEPAVFAQVSQRALLDQYCVTCHNERLKTGGLALDTLTLDRVGADAETWEKVVRKVRAGLMPPAGAKRPDRGSRDGFATAAEAAIDRFAAQDPNPGRTPLHRMNRVEYANAIRDLLSLDVDPTTLLPADDSSHGFDNIADVLGVSPSLLERYVSAAAKISRLAVGERDAAPAQVTYTVKGDLSQNRTLEGQPIGTRGGTTIRHNFPVEGEYLQGGIGELPAAGLVNVVVDDEQAQHALAVIRDWESSAPPVRPAGGRAGRAGPLAWLLAGALLGGAIVWTLCRSLRGL